MKEYLEIGKIVGTHALKGEVRVEPWCDSPEFIKKFKTLYFNGGTQELSVESVKIHKTIAIVKLKGTDKVEEADLLRGKVLYIKRSDAKLPKGRYFVQDIIGLKAVNDEDERIIYGEITNVYPTGANDVYEITSADGKTTLIPVIDDVVIKVDIENGKIFIHPLGGMFDDED